MAVNLSCPCFAHLQVDGGDPKRHLLRQPFAAKHQERPLLMNPPPSALLLLLCCTERLSPGRRSELQAAQTNRKDSHYRITQRALDSTLINTSENTLTHTSLRGPPTSPPTLLLHTSCTTSVWLETNCLRWQSSTTYFIINFYFPRRAGCTGDWFLHTTVRVKFTCTHVRFNIHPQWCFPFTVSWILSLRWTWMK